MAAQLGVLADQDHADRVRGPRRGSVPLENTADRAVELLLEPKWQFGARLQPA